MLKTGILNPAINSLISRVRHTNTLVIADRGFPFWPPIETIDISLVDDIPRVLDVVRAIRSNFVAGQVFMAEEFLAANGNDVRLEFGVRHTHTLVIADRGFPFWPPIETIDISLVDDIPRVLDLVRAIRSNFVAGQVFMAGYEVRAN